MNMYLRFKRVFPREYQALDIWRRFFTIGAELNAHEGGSFTVRLPLGKRPDAIYKYVQRNGQPGDAWDLIGVADDGAEVLMPQFPAAGVSDERGVA
jgi:hypothetical protein